MIRTLELKINCGEKTCASKPGEFCRFFLHRFGTPSCFCSANSGTRRMGGCSDTKTASPWMRRLLQKTGAALLEKSPLMGSKRVRSVSKWL